MLISLNSFKTRKFSKGFTLIELLVVISIIGLLSSIALAGLTQARLRAADANIKSNLNTVRSQAALYYTNNNGSYGATPHTEDGCSSTATGNILADVVIKAAVVSANTSSGGIVTHNRYTKTRCAISSSSWTVAVALKTDASDWWCVDSSNVSKLFDNPSSVDGIILGDGSAGSPYVCGAQEVL